MFHLILAAATSLFPLHATVLDQLPSGSAIVRADAAPMELPPGLYRIRLEPRRKFQSGTGIDGYLDRSTHPWTLRDVTAAAPFAPGLPDVGRVTPVDLGDRLPAVELIDQNGRRLQLDRAFAGKTTLISFVFTRCPDDQICPAISGKYAYLQSHLDPAKFALVEITLDPPYDSPAVLRQYGARYGARDDEWTFLTGKGSTVARLLDTFRIDSLRVSPSNYLHGERLFIVAPNGRVAYVVETAGWDPRGVLAQARQIAGMGSNPFERFKLSLVASVVAICGGSQYAGVVLLEMAVFAIIVVIVAAALWAVARVLWAKPSQ
ncbi:MAG TPA: SCO family protein [Candidatus Acidoferrales bacterium]|nr:SCO family protein [Candidatus Acidoferrales bacterium]